MNFKIKFHFTRYILLLIFLFFIINGVVENIIITRKIDSFIHQATLVDEDVENGIKFYCVSRETSKPSLVKIDGTYYIGQEGDILLKKASPFPEIPVFHQLTTFFVGGHAAYVIDGKTTIEINGKDFGNNKVSYYGNIWFTHKECIGVRLKNQNIVSDVTENIKSKVGSKYNYTFLIDNGYYCTDLMSKSVCEVSRKNNINDYGFTTANDIITSKNVDICYYHYTDTKGIKHVYYVN